MRSMDESSPICSEFAEAWSSVPQAIQVSPLQIANAQSHRWTHQVDCWIDSIGAYCENVLLGIRLRRKDYFGKKVRLRYLGDPHLSESQSRREMSQLAIRSAIDCFHSFLSSTFMSFTFLMMFGAMWIFDIHFDTRFFAVAYSLLSHAELFFMDWFTEAIRNVASYMAAEKRIRVSLIWFVLSWYLIRQF